MESALNEYRPASTGMYNSPASSVMSIEMCHLTPVPEMEEQEVNSLMIQPGDNCVKVVQASTSSLVMPEVGISPIHTPFVVEPETGSITGSEHPTEESATEESAKPSNEDIKKLVHASRAAVAVHRLQPPVEVVLDFADSTELFRRGLRLDRFLPSHQETKGNRPLSTEKMKEIEEQPLFLDIYENKAALKKHKKKLRKKRKRKASLIKLDVQSRSTASDVDINRSVILLDEEVHGVVRFKEMTLTDSQEPQKPQKKKITATDWINVEIKSNRKKITPTDWINVEIKRRETQKVTKMERETMNEERRLTHYLQRVERQRNLPRHENCIQPQVIRQVSADQVLVSPQVPPPVVQGHLPISTSRLRPRIPYQMSMSVLHPPTGRPGVAPSRPLLPEDPRNRMYVIVRDTYAPPKMPVPTPLEERLLKERFPNYKLPFSRQRPRLIERRVYTPSMTSMCIPREMT
ncbi:uncharacterized protein [Heptranchias perlo]|uniref:uncharacterized protein n=1 Tax=Heptranchias perlo TaxID=212740 RepID=UPI00355A913D